jgi:hypothetical protein
MSIEFAINKDEALVLYDLLAGHDDVDSPLTLDDAERKVLWKIEGQLEKLLVESLFPNYQQLVEEAKRNVLEGE